MSRGIPDSCLWSCGCVLSLFEWLCSSGGVDVEFSDELVVDKDVGFVAGSDGGGCLAGVSDSESNGVGAGDPDGSSWIDTVVVDSGDVENGSGLWDGFGGGVEHCFGCVAADASVGSFRVVDVTECVEFVLELSHSGWGGS